MICMAVLRDYQCQDCGRIEEYFGGVNELFICNCKTSTVGSIMRYVIAKAPNSNSLGAEGSDRQIAAMKNDYQRRFVKKEIDDVRHKHGAAFDQSLAGAAVQRIKDGKV